MGIYQLDEICTCVHVFSYVLHQNPLTNWSTGSQELSTFSSSEIFSFWKYPLVPPEMEGLFLTGQSLTFFHLFVLDTPA